MDVGDRNGRAIAGLLIMVGLMTGGWLLGAQIKSMKLIDRSVDVKGLSERIVKSDQADWALTFKTAGDELAGTFAQSEQNKNSVLQFLAAQGVKPAEITVGQISVSDRQTENGNGKGKRYILDQTVSVSSKDVDKLAAAGQKTSDLVKAGVVLGGNSNISYTFTGFAALKPDMITEALRNARASATRFAQDSGSKVGSIKSANQGVFSISAAAQSSADEESGVGGNGADTSIMKKVRVVATIEYYLVN